jgi:hypothetical protein
MQAKIRNYLGTPQHGLLLPLLPLLAINCPIKEIALDSFPSFPNRPFHKEPVMASRIRHCLECPACSTRYVIGFSPYDNGSYIVSNPPGGVDLLKLYCSCGNSDGFRLSELKTYAVSESAYPRGYGSPDEIVTVRAAGKKAS